MKRMICLMLVLAMSLAMGTAFAAEKALTVVFPGNVQSFLDGEDENNNFIIHYIEEQSGVDLTWQVLPQNGEDAKSKLNVMMTSTPPDLIFTGDRNTFLNYYNEGMLLPLDEYVPEDFFPEDVEAVAEVGVLDGQRYAIATPGNQSGSTTIWMYNKELLDAANIEVPETITLDDFTSILYAVKEAYPDKVPLGAAGNGSVGGKLNGLEFIYGAFGIADPYRVTEDGALEYAYTSDDMEECMAYLGKLYADGILDKEYLVTTKDTLTTKIANDNVVTLGAAWYDYTGAYRNLMADDEGAGPLTKWGQCSIIHGDKATSGQTQGSRTQFYCMVSYACKDPQAAMDVVRVMCSDDFYRTAMYGEEGVDYIYNDEGKRVRTDSVIGKAFAQAGAQFYVYYYIKETKDLRIDRMGMSQSEERLANSQHAFYNAKEVENPLEIMPNIPEYTEYNAGLGDLAATYFVKFVMDEAPITDFAKYRSEYDAMGGTELLDALNEWYTNR